MQSYDRSKVDHSLYLVRERGTKPQKNDEREKTQREASQTFSAQIIPMLHSPHWLPTEQRIEYELFLLRFKTVSHQLVDLRPQKQ